MLKQTSRWSGFVVFGLFGKGKRVLIALSNSALTFDASGTLQPYSDRITGILTSLVKRRATFKSIAHVFRSGN
jgi:hypothetical protein